MKLRIRLVSMMLLGAASIPAFAEDVYKSTMPDGRVIYGESAQPGAQRVEKIAASAAPTGTIVATQQEKDRADAIKGPSAPAVGVIPPAPREAAPALQSGTINPPGVMPKRSY